MGDGGGMGGGWPTPSIQKPIPSPRAKKGPSKKSGQDRGDIEIFLKSFSLIFCGFLSEEMALVLLKNFAFLSHFFTKIPSAKIWFVPPHSPPLPLP